MAATFFVYMLSYLKHYGAEIMCAQRITLSRTMPRNLYAWPWDWSLPRSRTKGSMHVNPRRKSGTWLKHGELPYNKPTRFSPLRDFEAQHFDYLVAILFNSDFSVHRAAKIPWAAISDEMSFHSDYVNGRVVYVRDALWTAPEALDITSNLRQAENVF